MPRKPRNFQKGDIYHITNRGTEGRDIFLSEQDYARFILALEFFNSPRDIKFWDLFFYKTKRKNGEKCAVAGSDPATDPGTKNTFSKELGVSINKERIKHNKSGRIVDFLAFCLMPNHYHLILREIDEGGISSFVRKLGGYSSYFNKQNGRSGSLFQSRYRATPIKSEEQLVVAFNYVHGNPVGLWESEWKNGRVKEKEKTIKRLYEYKKSSLLDYVGKRNHPTVTNRCFFLDFFGGTKRYKENIENYVKKEKNYYIEDYEI